jgi:predicted extracellular nuclease
MKKLNLLLLALLVMLTACSDKSYRIDNSNIVVTGDNSLYQSSAAGNLMATAIQKENKLDVVLYPTELMNKKFYGLVKKGMNTTEVNDVLSIFPEGIMDQFRIGMMKGRDIKKLVTQRTSEKYIAELEVAGLNYHIHYVGGVQQYANFSRERDIAIDDKTYYRIAISNFFYFNSLTFPGYRLRNSLNFTFKETDTMISARDSLKSYLAHTKNFPNLQEVRAKVSKFVKGDAGFKRTYEIQGAQHLSPLYGKKVRTTGVITALSRLDWYPGGIDLYIQDKKGDGNDHTSDAVHVYLPDASLEFEIGDEIEISGIIYEQMMRTGLSRTSIREVSKITKIASNQALPKSLVLGSKGRKIPKHHVSSYKKGDLNKKTFLNLNDGIDFYESIEGMRVSINDPRVLGFSGGKEELVSINPKSYLSIYLLPDGNDDNNNSTPAGGLILNSETEDYNPEIILLTTNHMTKGIDTKMVLNVGDQLDGKLEGVLSYERNTFGDGEYTFILPIKQPMFNIENFSDRTVWTEDRGITTLKGVEDKLSVATYNIENLGGNNKERIDIIAKSIAVNLKCPDILNLVEVQDHNGTDFAGSSSADKTLEMMVKAIKCSGVKYKFVNIDPINHNEGGQPGGNIRVAMMYNSNRVSFTPRGTPNSRSETWMTADGSLNINPGRVAPNSSAFKRTRKSLVAEFMFKGEKVFVIGNHFNSKLGDTSFWSNMQPPVFGSERKRALLATQINKFVQEITRKAPESNIVVLGDFNAHIIENPMTILEGKHLKNLMKFDDLIPANERYTTNFRGNSQPLDYIFVNQNLLDRNPEIEILHINSDFMGRLSDHDPVISRFQF